MAEILEVPLQTDSRRDALVWILDNSGNFSTKSMCVALVQQRYNLNSPYVEKT